MRAYLSCLFDSATVTQLDKANRQMRDSDGSAMQAYSEKRRTVCASHHDSKYK